jgi:two-component sensor histidine kinase/PAS domain-containing protein
MTPFIQLIELGIIFAFGISLVAGLFQLLHFGTAISRWCGCLLIGISINLACYYLLFTNLIPEIGRLLVVLQVAGYLLLTLSFMVFIIIFTGHPKWVSNLTMIFVTIIPFFILLLMVFQWGNISSSLISKAAAFGVNTNIFKPPFGIVEALFIAYANLVAFFSIFLLLLMLFNISNIYHKTIWLLICGAITIETAGMIEIIGANPFTGVSILQLAVALNTIPIILIVFTWKSVNSVPISQQLFKDTMRDGYLIIDSENRLVDFNQSFRSILGESTKVELGQSLQDISPILFSFLIHNIEQKSNPQSPFLFSGKDLVYETMVYPIGEEQNENLGRMVVFHNVTERDQMEDTLRMNNVELSRTNTFFSALANLTVSLQTVNDSAIFLDTLGKELLRLGLKCFVALYQPDSNKLKVMHVSESIETIRAIEKVFGRNLFGVELDRNHFHTLYQILDTRQIHYMPDEKSGLMVFLGNLPGWIMDPLVKASAVRRKEASMLIPLVAAEKVIGVIGVWGDNLREEDITPFRIFGSQIGWAIEKANYQETEVRTLEELSHSNAMITTLSKVSSLIEATSDNVSAFVSLGKELTKIGLSCAIVTLDEEKTIATIRYVSFQTDSLQKVENITGLKLVGCEIPNKYWPGQKATHEGIPVWYENPVKVFLKIFPGLPIGISNQLQPILNSIQTGQLCFLPLRVQEKVIGVMPIWGPNLSPRDNTTLSIFGDQVAAILRRNTSYEVEIRKSGEMARSNSMILALSEVASQLDSTIDLSQVLDTLGKELKKVNLNCMVGTIDDTKQVMKVEYLTFMEETKRVAQKFGLHWHEEMKIPRHLWPTEQAITEKAPTWDPSPIGNAYRMFPYIPKELFIKAMRMVGWDLTEPVCYLPMINDEDVIGILSVWGKGLRQADIPALSIFANQVATAIRNTRLYMNAQKEIDERTQAEIRIREALTEKEVLLKEVHHRVKNNLQVISSLLNLQAAEITDPNTLIALRESQNRVRSMALIHEKLYQSNDLAHIDFSIYLQSLVYSLAQSYRVQANKVDIQVQAEKIFLDLDTAIPCGLMVNELVSNSIKYAFPEDRSGKIIVSFSSTAHNRYSLAVSDDGIGLPAGFDYKNSSSLGLKLVDSLVRQIDAKLVLDCVKGTRVEINFSKPETSKIP